MGDSVKVAGPYDITVAELDRMSAERQRQYEVDDLLNRELDLAVPEAGNDVMAAAAVHLRARGVLLADATQEQLLDALVAVSR